MGTVAPQGRCKACQIWVNKQRQMLKPPVEKTCTMCNVLKPATDFNRDSNCSDGLKVGAWLVVGQLGFKATAAG